MKRFIIIAIVIIAAGCNPKTQSVAIFFNSSNSLNIETYNLKVVSNSLTLLDTVVHSNHVDQSNLVKCLKVISKDTLHLIVNGKGFRLSLDTVSSPNNCVSVFMKYNNQIKLRELYVNHTAKSIKRTGVIPDYNTFVDSLTAYRTTDKYDSLLVQVNKDKCGCK
jgi:hypothetical protein